MKNAEKRRIVNEFLDNPVLMLGLVYTKHIAEAINLRHGLTLSASFVGDVRDDRKKRILDEQAAKQQSHVDTETMHTHFDAEEEKRQGQMFGDESNGQCIEEEVVKPRVFKADVETDVIDEPEEEEAMSSSKEIKVFTFPITSQTVRVIFDENGKPWWVATDVCRVLGYVNAPQAISRHCKPDGISKRYTIDNMGRQQEVTVIDEYNLYRLMGKSEAPNAEPFQDWLYEKVLPAIRETGAYEGGFGGTESRQKAAPQPEPQKQIESSIKIDPHVMNLIKTDEGKSKYAVKKNALRIMHESSDLKSLIRTEWLSVELDAAVVKDYTGEDILADIRPHVVFPDTDKDLPAQEIGKAIYDRYKVNLSSNRVNVLLTDAGMQVTHRDQANRIVYTVTPKGAEYGVVIPIAIPGGGSVMNQRWNSKTVDIVWDQYCKEYNISRAN